MAGRSLPGSVSVKHEEWVGYRKCRGKFSSERCGRTTGWEIRKRTGPQTLTLFILSNAYLLTDPCSGEKQTSEGPVVSPVWGALCMSNAVLLDPPEKLCECPRDSTLHCGFHLWDFATVPRCFNYTVRSRGRTRHREWSPRG